MPFGQPIFFLDGISKRVDFTGNESRTMNRKAFFFKIRMFLPQLLRPAKKKYFVSANMVEKNRVGTR